MRLWLACLLSSLALTADAGARTLTVDDATLANAIAAPFVQTLEKAIHASDSAQAILVHAAQIERDALDEVAREHLLTQCALALAAHSPSAAGTQWLEALTARPVRIMVMHRHAGHATAIAAFDPAAAARFALREQAGVTGGLRKTANGMAAPANLAQWIANAHDLNAQTPPAALIKNAATRSDVAALIDVLRRGSALAARSVLANIDSLPAHADRITVLNAATTRASVADQSVFALARVVSEDPGLMPHLHGYLANPVTAMAAAAAIARLDRPDVAALLADELTDANLPEHAVRARVLALSLMQNETAQRRLRAWCNIDGPWQELRDKIRTARFEGDS